MKKIVYLNIFLLLFIFISFQVNAKNVPNLLGKWQGKNIKSTVKKGFVQSNNIVEITEQKDRLFKGYVIH